MLESKQHLLMTFASEVRTSACVCVCVRTCVPVCVVCLAWGCLAPVCVSVRCGWGLASRNASGEEPGGASYTLSRGWRVTTVGHSSPGEPSGL